MKYFVLFHKKRIFFHVKETNKLVMFFLLLYIKIVQESGLHPSSDDGELPRLAEVNYC